jgi:hypothetical protein
MSTNSQTWAGASVAADGAAQGGQLQPGQLRASKILGGAIYTAGNTKIGKVAELIIDKDGHVAAVIVDVAFVGLGKKSVAVDLGDISGADNHLILDRSIDELQRMTSYRTRQGWGRDLVAEFGRPTDRRSRAIGGTS